MLLNYLINMYHSKYIRVGNVLVVIQMLSIQIKTHEGASSASLSELTNQNISIDNAQFRSMIMFSPYNVPRFNSCLWHVAH